MRFVHGGWLALVACAVIAGCKTQEPTDAAKPAAAKAPVRTAKGGGLGPADTPGIAPASTNAATAAPTVLPTSGRIHSVNLGLRFVVIDYTLGGMPAMGSLLNVYRNNEKVGQVRLSGPEPRNGFVTGDVVEGYVQPEDEVRVH